VNEEKSRTVDLTKGESFGFLGFDFRRARSRAGKWAARRTPKTSKRTALLKTITKLRGWVDYLRTGTRHGPSR
jgi:RNA-directed DNA polymerase